MTAVAILALSFMTVLGSPGAQAQGAAGSTVTIDTKLVLVGSGAPIKDASQVVYWLTPSNHSAPPDPPAKHFRIVQQDKKFSPNFLVVPQGSTVDFPNLDPWFHNVFSQFRGKRFDLGLYQAGAQRSVKFDLAGVSYLFCNIHPDMTAIIVALDSNYYAVTDKAGHARITGIPTGRYELHAWYRDATPESLKAADRTVDVDQDRTLNAFVIQAKPQPNQAHKNKYGHDYDHTPLTPEY
jgi:plastocyanin